MSPRSFCAKPFPPLQTNQRQTHGFFHGHLLCFEGVESITTLHFQMCLPPHNTPAYILQTSWRYVEIHQKVNHFPGPLVPKKPNRVDLHRKT